MITIHEVMIYDNDLCLYLVLGKIEIEHTR